MSLAFTGLPRIIFTLAFPALFSVISANPERNQSNIFGENICDEIDRLTTVEKPVNKTDSLSRQFLLNDIEPEDFSNENAWSLGDHGIVSFKYQPVKASYTDTFHGNENFNNFRWHCYYQKTSRFLLRKNTPAVRTFRIHRNKESLRSFKTKVFFVKNGKVESKKLEKNAIKKKAQGDSVVYTIHFSPSELPQIIEFTFLVKSEYTGAQITWPIENDKVQRLSRVDFLIPPYLDIIYDHTGIDWSSVITISDSQSETLQFKRYVDTDVDKRSQELTDKTVFSGTFKDFSETYSLEKKTFIHPFNGVNKTSNGYIKALLKEEFKVKLR